MVGIDKAVIARLSSGSNVFEILVDCDNALKLKEGHSIGLGDVLATDKIFSDAKKGLLASGSNLTKVFATDDVDTIAKEINILLKPIRKHSAELKKYSEEAYPSK